MLMLNLLPIVACFLFSDLSRHITMQTLNNDGGYSKMGIGVDDA